MLDIVFKKRKIAAGLVYSVKIVYGNNPISIVVMNESDRLELLRLLSNTNEFNVLTLPAPFLKEIRDV